MRNADFDEDVALVRAIEAGEGTPEVGRDEVFRILEGEDQEKL